MSNDDRFHNPFLLFSEYVLELLDRSKEQFHAFFETTYGELYTEEKTIFKEYFSDLKKYFRLGGDLTQKTDKFFTTLFKKMFKVCVEKIIKKMFLVIVVIFLKIIFVLTHYV